MVRSPQDSVGIQIDARRVSSTLARLAHAAPVEKAAARRLAPEEQVLGDGEVGQQREFLEDGRDRRPPRASRGAAERDRLAVEPELARVRPMNAGEQLHQRRLAGAVLAGDGMDGAGRPAKDTIRSAAVEPKRLVTLRNSIRGAVDAAQSAIGAPRRIDGVLTAPQLFLERLLDHVFGQGRGEPIGVVEVGPVVLVEVRGGDRLRIRKIGLVERLALQQRNGGAAPSPSPRPGREDRPDAIRAGGLPGAQEAVVAPRRSSAPAACRFP